MLILLELLSDANAWTLLRINAAAVRVFESKVLRKIFSNEMHHALTDGKNVFRRDGYLIRQSRANCNGYRKEALTRDKIRKRFGD